MKTSKLRGPALDWAVAKCENKDKAWGMSHLKPHEFYTGYRYSQNWSQGGPIIERERICSFSYSSDEAGQPCPPAWEAFITFGARHYTGPTLLIAAMRCYVASKLGDEIEIPQELLK